MLYSLPYKRKVIEEKHFNPKIIGSIKSDYFHDLLNLNLKNNYFTSNDLNKEEFVKQYMDISKRVISNKDSIEELLPDGYSI